MKIILFTVLVRGWDIRIQHNFLSNIIKQGQARNPKANCSQTDETQCSCLEKRSVSEITSRVTLIHSNRLRSLAIFVPRSQTVLQETVNSLGLGLSHTILTWGDWDPLQLHRNALARHWLHLDSPWHPWTHSRLVCVIWSDLDSLCFNSTLLYQRASIPLMPFGTLELSWALLRLPLTYLIRLVLAWAHSPMWGAVLTNANFDLIGMTLKALTWVHFDSPWTHSNLFERTHFSLLIHRTLPNLLRCCSEVFSNALTRTHADTNAAFDLLALEPFEFHLSDLDSLRLTWIHSDFLSFTWSDSELLCWHCWPYSD